MIGGAGAAGHDLCLVVGRYPEPELELVRRAAAGRIELVVPEPGHELEVQAPVRVIWRLFAGRGQRDQFAAVLEAHPEVEWVHSSSAGIDRMAQLFEGRQATVLTHSAGVTAIPIAEFALGCLLSHVKRLPELRELQRQHRFQEIPLRELGDLRVVIFGTGAIATQLCSRLRPFGCGISGVRRNPERGLPAGFDQVLGFEELAAACDGADALVLAAPLTDETRGAVDREVLSGLAEGSVVVNVARGGLIDQDSLLAQLRLGRPSAAYLDTFVEEPLPEGSPLWDEPGVFISPHLSWSSANFQRRSSELFAEQLSAWLEGAPLANVANPAAGY